MLYVIKLNFVYWVLEMIFLPFVRTILWVFIKFLILKNWKIEFENITSGRIANENGQVLGLKLSGLNCSPTIQ